MLFPESRQCRFNSGITIARDIVLHLFWRCRTHSSFLLHLGWMLSYTVHITCKYT